ncbi:DoxX family protein [Clostridiales bacterium PH28_bin88]|nr:DoxX family protein [Clostridiales bacterium PH28_bin88]
MAASMLVHLLDFTGQFLDMTLLVLRVILAIVFASHGWYKSFGKQGFVESARRYAFHGIPFPLFFSYLVAISQLVAVPLLLLGLLTRWLALFLFVQMIVATWAKYRENGIFDGADLPMSTGAGCLLLLVLGPGAFALDAFI